MALLEDVGIGAINGDDPQKQIESVVKQTNEALRQLSNEDRTKIIKDDSGTQRLLTGFQQDGFDNGNVGVKLSQQGYDVTSATADQLIFSTDFNNFKIVASGTITIPAYSYVIAAAAGGYVGQSAEVTTAHGLSYRPAIIAFVESPAYVGSYSPVSQVEMRLYPGAPGGFSLRANRVWVDDTNIYSRSIEQTYVAGAGYGTTVNVDAVIMKYYLLRETAN